MIPYIGDSLYRVSFLIFYIGNPSWRGVRSSLKWISERKPFGANCGTPIRFQTPNPSTRKPFGATLGITELLRIEFPRGKTSTWVTLHILKWLRIEFRRGKTSIRRHPEIITTWGFRMLLRMKYFLGNTSIWATLGPRNWATWRSWAAFLASDDLGLKFSLEETQFWATPGFATLEAPWRLRLRLRRDVFHSWLGPPQCH